MAEEIKNSAAPAENAPAAAPAPAAETAAAAEGASTEQKRRKGGRYVPSGIAYVLASFNINMLAGNPINPINCGAIAMIGGFPVVWLVSLFTKKMPRTEVERMFECYKK